MRLVILALLVGCHSATLYVERRASGGTERDHHFEPLRGADGHYISFPAYPFVNCVDALAASTDLHDKLLSTPCWNAEEFTDFVGYREDELWPGARTSWIEHYANSAQERDLATILAVAKGIDCNDDASASNPACTAPVERPTAMFSFLHFSDVQIREPEAKLGGNDVSHTLDPLVPSFERDHDQELFSAFVYSAVVETVNAELRAYREIDASLPKDDPSRTARLPPQVMIHTGDAVDAGLQSEFDQFLLHSDKLDIPWFQAIGNHDALAFGNLRMVDQATLAQHDATGSRCEGEQWQSGKHQCTCTRIADLIREYNLAEPDNLGHLPEVPKKIYAAIPILLNRLCIIHEVEGDLFVMDPKHYGSTSESFIASHCRPDHDAVNGDRCVLPRKDLKYPGRDKNELCMTLDASGPPTVLNGFDLGDDPDLLHRVSERVAHDDSTLPPSSSKRIGYYCFQLETKGTDRKAWAIVLNTTTTSGAYGEVNDVQLDWLRSVLNTRGKRDLVLVFAHHPVWDILNSEARDRLTELLTLHSNVIGYFTGHTHEPGLHLLHPPGSHDRAGNYHHVWEIVAPALISFPQQVRQVTIKTVGDIGYIEVLSFSPVGTGESADRVQRAQAGARRDYCNEQRTSCVNGQPRLPSRTVSFPRLFFRLPP